MSSAPASPGRARRRRDGRRRACMRLTCANRPPLSRDDQTCSDVTSGTACVTPRRQIRATGDGSRQSWDRRCAWRAAVWGACSTWGGRTSRRCVRSRCGLSAGRGSHDRRPRLQDSPVRWREFKRVLAAVSVGAPGSVLVALLLGAYLLWLVGLQRHDGIHPSRSPNRHGGGNQRVSSGPELAHGSDLVQVGEHIPRVAKLPAVHDARPVGRNGHLRMFTIATDEASLQGRSLASGAGVVEVVHTAPEGAARGTQVRTLATSTGWVVDMKS